MTTRALQRLLREVRACTLCTEHLPLPPRPVLQAGSGARILTTLVHEMRRRAPAARRPYYGLAALCVGVGQGEAALIEWLD